MDITYLDTSIITVDIASIIAKNLAKCEIELLKVILPGPICVSPHIDLIYAAANPLVLCYKCNCDVHSVRRRLNIPLTKWGKYIIKNGHNDCMQNYIQAIYDRDNLDKHSIILSLCYQAIAHNNGDMLQTIITKLYALGMKIECTSEDQMATNIVRDYRHNCYGVVISEFRQVFLGTYIKIAISYYNLCFLKMSIPIAKKLQYSDGNAVLELVIITSNLIIDIIRPKYGTLSEDITVELNIDKVIDLVDSLSNEEIFQHEKGKFILSTIDLGIGIKFEEIRNIINFAVRYIKESFQYKRITETDFFNNIHYMSYCTGYAMCKLYYDFDDHVTW